MKIFKIGLISLSLVSALLANDNIVVDRSGVVVANGDESIVISDSADRDALVVNDKNIIISSQRAPKYASANEYVEAREPVYYQERPQIERKPVKRRVVDMSYDSVEVKHSNQNVGTAEVPVIFQLHPLTVHQYK